jgi:hypothetical protein
MVPAKLPGIVGTTKLGSNSLAPGKIANFAGQSKGQAIRRNASGSPRLINLCIFWGAQF